MNLEAQSATAALDILHGARALPATEAARELRDFLELNKHADSEQRPPG